MSKVLEMRRKRGEIWDKAKAFLDSHRDESGLLCAEDTEQYERMEQEVVDLGRAIEREERREALERELNAPVNQPLSGRPEGGADEKPGVKSRAYNDAFWKHMRDRAGYEARNALQVGALTEGGYTVPDEFEHTLVQALEEENIMRGLVHVISIGRWSGNATTSTADEGRKTMRTATAVKCEQRQLQRAPASRHPPRAVLRRI